MTILVVYMSEPKIPPTNQSVDAKRIQIGDKWIDYVGAAPTAVEVETFLIPRTVRLDAEELYDILASKGILTSTDRLRPKN